jgi:AraC-like DNA-binding protein
LDRFQYINNDFIGYDELLYRINRAGSGKVNEDFDIRRNSSYPYCVLHFVADGSGEIIYKNKKYHVKNGQCFVLNSFEAHCYRTNPNDPFELNWIEFNGGDCAKLIRAFLDEYQPVIDESQSRIINKYIVRILGCLKHNPKNKEIRISKSIYAILMCLLEECKNKSCNIIPESQKYDIQKVKNHISSNLYESLTMEQLAKSINYNPQYFAKLFQKLEGITPAKYILNTRISCAKDWLSSNDMKIDLLAEKLGFCNTSHFIRIFKKAEGLTPAEFRKESISYYKK